MWVSGINFPVRKWINVFSKMLNSCFKSQTLDIKWDELSKQNKTQTHAPMKLFWLNQTSKCPLFNDRRTQTHSPSPLRIVFIGASWCQLLVSGWYFSAVFQRVCPSYPPTTYRTPPHAATPAPRRATDIGQTKDQRLDSGSHLQNKKQWWGTCSQWNENLLPVSYNAT